MNLRPLYNAAAAGLRRCIYTIEAAKTFPEHVRVVDYRSDTFSYPSEEMRVVMFKAKVGDDVYGEDPTANELEEKAAKMLGKEAALFVASGTMSNLLAIMGHCEKRGCEIIVGDESHILLWEQAGAAQIGGAQLRCVKNFSNGTYSLDEVRAKVRNNSTFSFLPSTSLICAENSHNNMGGRVLPTDWINELGTLSKEYNIPLHLDGARFFNSVVATGQSPSKLAENFDSINICLSKGLGAPIGSLLIGTKDFIQRTRTLRKLLGGGMRQVGLMAAAGIYALDHMVERLKEDHGHTKAIAQAIHDTGSKIISVNLDAVETNILLVEVDTSVVKLNTVKNRLGALTDEEIKEDNPAILKVLPWSSNALRLVVCCNNNQNDLEATINKFKIIIDEYENNIFIE